MEDTTLATHTGPELVASSNETTILATRADVDEQLDAIGGLPGALMLVRQMNSKRLNENGRAFLQLVESIAKNPKTVVHVLVFTEGDSELDGKVARVRIGE